ncbi:MAG: ABC transporter permease [Acidobacteriaceae bacterium]|nr:ABC transporter permease [Acidobacteriaceae bacterium]MBV9778640.1 ABC transporter permease [Acidobacteriaceae bacterium]
MPDTFEETQGVAEATGQARVRSEAGESSPPPLGIFDGLGRDFRHAMRALYKKAGFTTVAVLTLALGIGANTAIFSIVNAALLTPIPIPHPGQVAMVWSDRIAANSQGFPASEPDFQDWQASGVFEELAGFITEGYNVVIGKLPERVSGVSVTREWFQIQQVKPFVGRFFEVEDMRPGHDHVAVLTYGFWTSHFNANPAIVGRSITINSAPYTLIGVLPKKIARLSDEELYVPLVFEPPLLNDRGMHGVLTVGRLAPGLTFAAAQTRIRDLSARLAKQFPKEDGAYRSRLQPIEEAYVEDVHSLLWVLFGAVGFVLLIACANIANLLLVRGTARQKEIAIRTALGASKWRLIRQLLTESVLLSLLAGVIGIIPAFLGTRFFTKMQVEQLPNADLVTMNFQVLIFTLALAIATGLLFGLVPAWQAWKANANAPLRERSQSSGGQRFGNLFVVCEIAFTVVLVTGAGLMLRSFLHLRSKSPGYEGQHTLTMRIALTGAQYGTPETQNAFYKELVARVETLPGVETAAVVNCLPTCEDVQGGSLQFTDRPQPKPGEAPLVTISAITPDYFRTMRIPLVAGRSFSEHDGANDPLVVIIDRELARQYWPNRNPIGQVIALRRKTPPRRIVGVVGRVDLSIAAKGKGRVGQVYISMAQAPEIDLSWGMSLTVSTPMDPTTLASTVRRTVASLAPDQPVFDVQTMVQAREKGQASARLGTWLLGFFALLALLLAAVGVYGVISYTVGQRTREIGLRMAVGASPFEILRMVLRRGILMIAVGIAIGLTGAVALTRLMRALLHEISTTDPASFLGAVLLLILIGLAACYVPAWRASRVDPTVALRYE